MSKVSRKSITVDRDLKKGETLKRGYLLLKRPGTGLYYKYIEKIIGKKIKNQIDKNYQIKLSDIY